MTSVLRSIGNLPALCFILPCLAVLAFTSLYPVGFGLVVSLTNWNWGSSSILSAGPTIPRFWPMPNSGR